MFMKNDNIVQGSWTNVYCCPLASIGLYWESIGTDWSGGRRPIGGQEVRTGGELPPILPISSGGGGEEEEEALIRGGGGKEEERWRRRKQ